MKKIIMLKNIANELMTASMGDTIIVTDDFANKLIQIDACSVIEDATHIKVETATKPVKRR